MNSINGLNISTAYQSAVNTQEKNITENEIKKEKDGVIIDKLELNQEESKSVTYTKPKGLSSEEISDLKEDQAESQRKMLEKMIQGYIENQASLNQGYTHLNFDGVKVAVDAFALPELATTPEEAEAAISEGGAYSVEKVADRIMGLAETLANGDSERLSVLKAAVTKGFEAAGADFKSVTNDDLPQICHDTYDEIMKRFDDLAASMQTNESEASEDLAAE